MELPFDPAILLLGLYPKNPDTPIQKNLCTPMFIAAQFTIAKSWKQPQCPSANEWIKTLWYIYTTELYAAERKKELIPFATAWMELESIMLSEISTHLQLDGSCVLKDCGLGHAPALLRHLAVKVKMSCPPTVAISETSLGHLNWTGFRLSKVLNMQQIRFP